MDQKTTGHSEPAESAEKPSTAAIAALSLTLFGVAGVLVAVALPHVSQHRGGLSTAWWLMVPAFAVSELFVANLRLGRSASAVSFGHVPLVVGLCLFDPTGLVAASLLGSAFTLLVHGRQRGLKLLFNVGLWSFEASLAVTLYGLFGRGAEPSSLVSIFAAFGAILVTDQLTGVAVMAVIYLHERQFDRSFMREALTWGVLVAIGNTSAGLLFVVLLERHAIAIPLLLVVLGVLLLSYRANEQLHESHEQLERYHGFAQSLVREHDTGSVIEEVLERTRELLHAEVAELHLAGRIHRSTSNEFAPSKTPTIATDYWLDRLRGSGGVSVLIRSTAKDPQEKELLAETGVSEAAAAMVSSADDTEGVLVVMERMGEAASFRTGDLRALETFAHQASIALDNGRLVDKLRREAADRAFEAMHDPLTGLPNRRQFLRSVEVALGTDTVVGVLLLDLDHFKDVNDALGHTVGDELLDLVARRLRANLPDEQMVARLGGDEFAVLIPGKATPDSVSVTVQLVCTALGEPLVVRGAILTIEASIGSAVSPQDGQDAEGLLQRADVAMYRAKGQRTGYEPYTAALDLSSSERLALHTELRRAVFEGLLEVHFQPCIHPLSGHVLSVEALARWRHPTLGDIGPDEFIPLAEGGGLIAPLTMLVLERALSELSRLRSQGMSLRMAVNLSPRLLLDEDLPDRVTALLRRTGVPADALTLEVTETAIMSDPAKALRLLEALDAAGILLSIDDFGTGHSSLAYLKHLPVGEVKIDQSFLRNLSQNPDDVVIVRSTIDLAHELGLSVVAEGVEDASTLELLGIWGCDAAQGFFVSRPMPSEQLGLWLRSRAGTAPAIRSALG